MTQIPLEKARGGLPPSMEEADLLHQITSNKSLALLLLVTLIVHHHNTMVTRCISHGPCSIPRTPFADRGIHTPLDRWIVFHQLCVVVTLVSDGTHSPSLRRSIAPMMIFVLCLFITLLWNAPYTPPFPTLLRAAMCDVTLSINFKLLLQSHQ